MQAKGHPADTLACHQPAVDATPHALGSCPQIPTHEIPIARCIYLTEMHCVPTITTHTGKIEEELILNNKYKAKVSVDSLTGPRGAAFSLTAKLGKPWASSVGIATSRAGPVLKWVLPDLHHLVEV